MPTNANTFNSRVTSEALEKKFRDTFPAQGGAELIQDLFASGVIVPTVDFTDAAKGSELSQQLQTAWDHSTGSAQIAGTTTNLVSNPGFWRVQGTANVSDTASGSAGVRLRLSIDDGTTDKPIWAMSVGVTTTNDVEYSDTFDFVVFLRAGDTFKGFSSATSFVLDVAYRQIATVNGDLVNPLGFTSS